ncbi:BamA/TamA family outer membrane protein [Suttonella sp. R2A3]|uniref:BamA/TamA family outer membrane protein n=1 Tax=Suttonella sp. R2A3 TaxID=2908648 RepID=UPI001F1D9227|nr:BamA/TamA family outer membrane protein [Suttonella sp. R2A3]UJF25428.1 BamA/TamA family outer membrane protein [Suttonella sp. R2A3]
MGFGKSKSTEKYTFDFTDPYFTADGISANYSLLYAKYDFEEEDLSNWAADERQALVTFGYPLSEYQTVYFGGGYRGLDINLGYNVAPEIKRFIDDRGDSFHEGVATLSWTRDTLDDPFMPTKGTYNSLGGEVTIPGSSETYYRLNYRNNSYFSFGEDSMVLGLRGNVAYGDGYGDSSDLPFFRHYYAGGISTVRGYKYGTIGPRYSNGDNAGGDFRINGGADLIFPRGFGDPNSAYRMGLFVDAGSAYSSVSDFDADDLRYSAGVFLQWMSPVGPLNLSWARPLNKKDGDKTESFQFTLGRGF